MQEVIQRVERVHFALVPDPQAPREDDRAHRVRQTGDGPIGDILAARAPPHAVEPHHETQDALDFLPPSVGAGQHHRLRGGAQPNRPARREKARKGWKRSARAFWAANVCRRGVHRASARGRAGSPRHTRGNAAGGNPRVTLDNYGTGVAYAWRVPRSRVRTERRDARFDETRSASVANERRTPRGRG